MRLLNDIETKELSSPIDAITYFNGDLDNHGQLGFRGHGNSAWHLETTLSRFISQCIETGVHGHRDRAKVTKIIRRTLEEKFRENIVVNNDLPTDAISQTDIWQFGQHHGLPSPLLDWTESAFVALFFALHEIPEDGLTPEPCVWVLNKEVLSFVNHNIQEHIWPKWTENLKPESLLHEQFPKLSILREYTGQNRRMSYQRAFFTKHEFYISFEVWLNRIVEELIHPASEKPLLHKVKFPCSNQQRVAALGKLEQMNISYRTLFPDVYGSANSAKISAMQALQHPPTASFSFAASP